MCRNQGRGAEKRVTGTNPGCPLVSESFPPEETWPDPSELRSTCLWSRGIRTWALKLNSLQAEPPPATRQASTGPGSLLALPFLSCSPWAAYLTSLCLSVLMCKPTPGYRLPGLRSAEGLERMTVPTAQGGRGNWLRYPSKGHSTWHAAGTDIPSNHTQSHSLVCKSGIWRIKEAVKP